MNGNWVPVFVIAPLVLGSVGWAYYEWWTRRHPGEPLPGTERILSMRGP